jgi:hypothetical protein
MIIVNKKSLDTERGASPLQFLLFITSFTLLSYCCDLIRVGYFSSRLNSLADIAVESATQYIIKGKEAGLYDALLRNRGQDFFELDSAAEWKKAVKITNSSAENGLATATIALNYSVKTLFMGLYGFEKINIGVKKRIQYSTMEDVVEISTGRGLSCAIDIHKDVWCWGKRGDGPSAISDVLPYKVALPIKVKHVFVGHYLACATSNDIPASSKVYCWNDGIMDPAMTGPPKHIPALDGSIKLSLGEIANCALLYSGNVLCWTREGYNGELGDGTFLAEGTGTGLVWPPHLVSITNVKDISAGFNQVCALKNTDEIFCWGDDLKGALGVGSFKTYTGDYTFDTDPLYYMARGGTKNVSPFRQGIPVGPLAGIPNPKELVGCTFHRMMTLGTDGKVYGWGLNDNYQLAISPSLRADWYDKPLTSSPEQFFAPSVKNVLCGVITTCIQPSSSDHDISCVGSNSHGLLGQGDPASTFISTNWLPIKANWTGNIIALASRGDTHFCIIDSTFTPWCWGYNISGALGYGDAVDIPNSSISSLPRPIIRARILYT